jgi:Fe-Mn family superoxide dismutase
VYNKATKVLEYHPTPNQDNVKDNNANHIPLLTIDIWEHAFYIDYKNVKGDFMKEIWKVVNWEKVSQRLKEAK